MQNIVKTTLICGLLLSLVVMTAFATADPFSRNIEAMKLPQNTASLHDTVPMAHFMISYMDVAALGQAGSQPIGTRWKRAQRAGINTISACQENQ